MERDFDLGVGELSGVGVAGGLRAGGRRFWARNCGAGSIWRWIWWG